MKKIGIALTTILAVSVLTTGCGREIEVKNGSKVAVSTTDNKLTATEYYEKIKEDNISTLIDMIDHGLFDEKYKTDDKEKKEIENQINQIKSYYGQDEATYLNLIQQYFGVKNEDELREMLSLEYKRNLAIEDYLKEELKESEIKKYYDENIYGEVEASHILITIDTEENATEEEIAEADKKAKETTEDIIKQLKDGKKFSDLAKKYSKDEATASNGGSLGYFDINTMVDAFKENNYLGNLCKKNYQNHKSNLFYKY